MTIPHPKMLTERFLPGLAKEHEVGLGGVGVSVIDCTIACNSAMTAAQLLAGPPNTNANVNACGPIVHSLGTAPTASFVMLRGAETVTGLGAQIQFRYCTADNSAAYVWAQTWTGAVLGCSVRLIAVR